MLKFAVRLRTGTLVALFAVTSPGVHAAQCPPVAVLDGAGEIVPSVRALLRAHGVVTEPRSCSDAAVHARLVSDSGVRGYRLRIVDSFGHVSERQVTNAVTAASLIESWALPETDPLVSPPPVAQIPAVVRTGVTTPPPAMSTFAAWRVGTAAEVAEATDGSFWYGATITGCVRLGRVCAGLRLRYARDDGFAGPNTQGSDLTRTALGALALVGVPLRAGSATVMPLAGVGVERLHSEVLPAGAESNPFVSDVSGVRVEAGGLAAFPISRSLLFVAEVNAGFGRWLSSGRLARSGDPNGGVTVDPPAGFVRAAIGCQYTP